MIEDFEKEINNLIALFDSCEAENMKVALQIAKGRRKVAAEVKKHYSEMLMHFFGRVQLRDLLRLPKKLSNMLFNAEPIPYFKYLERLLPSLPVNRIYYTEGGTTQEPLREFPWWIFHLPQLVEINFSHNEISHIPNQIATLSYLEFLNLNNNKVEELPDALCELRQLRHLQLDFNQIKTVPANIGNLRALEWLCLESNKIKRLPKSALDLDSLYWLSIEKTPLGKRHNINTGIYTSTKSEQFIALIEEE